MMRPQRRCGVVVVIYLPHYQQQQHQQQAVELTSLPLTPFLTSTCMARVQFSFEICHDIFGLCRRAAIRISRRSPTTPELRKMGDGRIIVLAVLAGTAEPFFCQQLHPGMTSPSFLRCRNPSSEHDDSPPACRDTRLVKGEAKIRTMLQERFPMVIRSPAGALLALFLVATCSVCSMVGILSPWRYSLLNDSFQKGNLPQKVIMFTYVFGEKQTNKRLFRLFVESTRGSGIDIAIVGHPKPKFPLPSNVRHVSFTWDAFTDRVSAQLFNGTEPGDLRDSQREEHRPYRKINDFKPLTGYLFPEVTKGYAWWGHVDNDMVLGNLRAFLTHSTLLRFDVITSFYAGLGKYTMGPFTLYRNTPRINELFRLADRSLEELFGNQHYLNFDEWGAQWSNALYPNSTHRSFDSSMSGILTRHAKRLGIRYTGLVPGLWDGLCQQFGTWLCFEFRYLKFPNGRQRLMGTWRGIGLFEVSNYHFQRSKDKVEEQLESDAVMNELLLAETGYQYIYEKGFVYSNGTRFHGS